MAGKRMRPDFKWTEERKKQLEEMYVVKEMSSGQCAKALSTEQYEVTRNQVVGAVNRFGLRAKRPDAVNESNARRRGLMPKARGPLQVKPKVFNYGSQKMLSDDDLAAPSSHKLEITPEDTPPEERIGIMELSLHTCRWPYDHEDGVHYCGRRTRPPSTEQIFPFCEYHQKRASSPPTRKLRVPSDSSGN